ncbi:XPG I-region-domain-containing protein [Hysterangium stoloniferum]|nr:XPG I-region-domain-containing protein [Hysterangium stoloniferum]
MLDAFGFDCHTAPGKAEAELAYLNKIHIIDAVITNDGDSLIWGAKTVISYNGAQKHDTNHAYVFRAKKILEHPKIGLDQDGFLLIALFCGDYNTSYILGMGIKIAMGLAQAGLWKAANKYLQLSKTLPTGFPEMMILELYSNPLTSERVCYPVDEGCKYWKAVTLLKILHITVAWDFNTMSHEKSISMPQMHAWGDFLPEFQVMIDTTPLILQGKTRIQHTQQAKLQGNEDGSQVSQSKVLENALPLLYELYLQLSATIPDNIPLLLSIKRLRGPILHPND